MLNTEHWQEKVRFCKKKF